MDNRRNSDRCPTNLACRVSLQAGRTASGRILDVSRDGVRFEFTGPATAWDGPRVRCYLNGYLLERSLNVRWTRVENDRVVVGAQFEPAVPHVMIEQFVRYAAWQAQATEPAVRKPTTRRINPWPVFSRDGAAGATRPLKLDASMRVAYARRRET